jgi:hypothetical protein
LFAAHELGEHHVVALYAVRNRLTPRSGGLDIHSDKPVHPTGRRFCRGRSDAVREVAVRVLEPGPITEYSVDHVCFLGIGQRIHIDFHRLEQLVRWVRDLAMDRLAADDHEFV